MNAPEDMTPAEAAELLGVSREASPSQIERAYAEKLEALEKKIAQAATAALKNKYRVAMDRLKLAREVMEKEEEVCDLPSLEISELASPPPLRPAAPEPMVAAPPAPPAPAPAPTPAPAPVAPAAPKKPLPVKAIGIALAALVLIGAAMVLLRDPATAVYAGDYRKRISYDSVVYDYSITVAKNGEITGTNQVADKNIEPVKITGKVEADGKLTATGEDKSRYIGQIRGDDMELEEQFESSDAVVFNLTRGLELPAEPPQAEWAGVYHNPSVEYPAGKYEMRFEVEPNGHVTAHSRKLTNEAGVTFEGRVNTKGKFTATHDLNDGDVIEYTGSVDGEEMIVEETLPDGATFMIRLTKGEKESITLSPHAGVYRNRITYEKVIFDFDVTIADDGSLSGTSQIADDSQDAVTLNGSVSADGTLQATGSDDTQYSGSITDGEIELNEKVGESNFTFKLVKDRELPAEAPQAAYAGTYVNISVVDTNNAAFEYEFTIAPDGGLTGSYTSADGSLRVNISGRVGTKGIITAEGTPYSNGFKNTYTGQVTDQGLELTETLRNGGTFSFIVPKS
ncbi:MAG: hypothetical protein MUF31_03075 [Akkermansiaceae bacterium]|jgi:phage gp45-like|nr:hypothetical protein [Akkermansiaceae bacterium]